MVLVHTDTGKNSFGPYEKETYCTGTARGKNVLIRRCISWFCNKRSKPQIHWETQLEGACCWIAPFRTAKKAAAFYGIILNASYEKDAPNNRIHPAL